NGVALCPYSRNIFGRLPSKILIGGPLHNWKKGLSIIIGQGSFFQMLNATFQPSMGQMHGSLCVVIIAWVWGTFIKGHNDIGTDDTLNFHNVLRGEYMIGTINVRLKPNPF